VFFSSSNFPSFAQPLIKALPLTALVDAMRGVVLEGASLGAIRVELMILATWAIACFAIALRIFKWR
jgi:ABC-2 type transport system permease protein